MTVRVALGVEYDGSAYNGWQRQRVGHGVQERLEAALAAVAAQEVETDCAGRTDTGVHATAQVVHFDTSATRSKRSWLLGANSNLPDDINVTWVEFVADDFHARYSATSRSYRYVIWNHLVRSALYRQRAWWLHAPLDVAAMREAAALLIGEHDFSAFRAAGCQARTAVRELTAIVVERHGDWVALTITANAFLQHMVRNLAGCLAAIGSGERMPAWAAEVLASRDRRLGGVTAPAHGLTLVRVDYPDSCGVPVPPLPDLAPVVPTPRSIRYDE